MRAAKPDNVCAILSKAVVRAAYLSNLRQAQLARLLGLSAAMQRADLVRGNLTEGPRAKERRLPKRRLCLTLATPTPNGSRDAHPADRKLGFR